MRQRWARWPPQRFWIQLKNNTCRGSPACSSKYHQTHRERTLIQVATENIGVKSIVLCWLGWILQKLYGILETYKIFMLSLNIQALWRLKKFSETLCILKVIWKVSKSQTEKPVSFHGLVTVLVKITLSSLLPSETISRYMNTLQKPCFFPTSLWASVCLQITLVSEEERKKTAYAR